MTRMALEYAFSHRYVEIPDPNYSLIRFSHEENCHEGYKALFVPLVLAPLLIRQVSYSCRCRCSACMELQLLDTACRCMMGDKCFTNEMCPSSRILLTECGTETLECGDCERRKRRREDKWKWDREAIMMYDMFSSAFDSSRSRLRSDSDDSSDGPPPLTD